MGNILKRFLNFGELPSMYYFRTRDGLEIDCLIEIEDHISLFEIKSTSTILPKHASSLLKLKSDLGKAKKIESLSIISSSKDGFVSKDVKNYNWKTALDN